MPKAFRLKLKNVPGALAKVAGALGKRGVNIEASAGETLGGEGRVTLLTSDPAASREVLAAQGVSFEEIDLFLVTLEDRPGSLAQVAKKLAEAQVNITGLVQISRAGGRSELGFAVDNPERARSILR